MSRTIRTSLSFLGILITLALLWEGYKYMGQATGGTWPFTDVALPVRTNERSMPHLWDIGAALLRPARRGGDSILFIILLEAALFTFRSAFLGFVIGSAVGFFLGVLFVRSSMAERGLMPYVVASQTIPILAIAPILVVWAGRASVPKWVVVAVISAYLAFFPVAINTLRGLRSPEATASELMRSYAASPNQVLWKLQVPAALPYLFPALKVAATASIIGAIVGELPASMPDGLGRGHSQLRRRILCCAREAVRIHRGGVVARHRIRRAHCVGRTNHAATRSPNRRDCRDCEPNPRGDGRMNTLELSGVTKVFNEGTDGRVEALRGIDLAVEPGEFISLIGPSGCGKSTLLRLVGDLLPPSQGTVTVNGKAPHQARLDRDYGMVFQSATLLEWRKIRANVELPLEIMGVAEEERAKRADEMLALVQLEQFADHYPWQLSGGMQQRVAIARALAFSPSILLMDEPFGALDEMTRERMQMELLQIWEETDTTILFVTHSIPEAVFLSTRVVIMSPRPGEITEIIDIDLPQPRVFETREDQRFFSHLTRVREGLRAVEKP